MSELTIFQRAAVDHICKRLEDSNGTRRYLLADEVGLGKTIIARGVIEKLNNIYRGMSVIYICSNNDIIEQNRKKLSIDEDTEDLTRNTRLTLLPLHSKDIESRRNSFQMFSFTPNTSLQVNNSAGLKRERQLIMYLIYRLWNKDIQFKKWRNFFRCGVLDEESWHKESSLIKLQEQFERQVTIEFQEKLKVEWDNASITLNNRTQENIRKNIDTYVDLFSSNPDINPRKIIGVLRECIAKTALEYIKNKNCLIIMDEFQRFKDILDINNNSNTIVSRLLSMETKYPPRVLILSATPYKMYTLSHEEENHYEDFINTLEFLFSGNKKIITKVSELMKRFIELIKENRDHHDIMLIKQDIELLLKKVMSRTERNWYIDDINKGIREIPEEINTSINPKNDELIEYIRMNNFLKNQEQEFNIIDYWKSCPSIFSFMDSSYSLMRNIRTNKSNKIPESICISSKEDITYLKHRNMKFRLLFEKAFSQGKMIKHLWVKPTYTYYSDIFYRDYSPNKYLVFSHWRFVPKAISILASNYVEELLDFPSEKQNYYPIKFNEDLSLYVFNVCYPSLALTDVINIANLVNKNGIINVDKIIALAKINLEKLLSESNIKIGKSTTEGSYWRVVCRLESLKYKEIIVQAIKSSNVTSDKKEYSNIDSYYFNTKNRFIDWLDDNTPLTISNEDFNRLVDIALFSPANSLLRSMRSLFLEQNIELIYSKQLINLCMNQLRNYFNKTIVQSVINTSIQKGDYNRKIIDYCKQAHIQAMFDEYCYLLKNVEHRTSPDEIYNQIGNVLSIGTGSPKINQNHNGNIKDSQLSCVSHYAISMGEDIQKDLSETISRKSTIREAFNSPFYPFILSTTSVGQEGLDLHLYCNNIIHWNLPSNPVDLEQREGRLNRYDSLCIRKNISNDYSVEDIINRTDVISSNVWEKVFQIINNDSLNIQRYKHGLFPHWVYESNKENETINRHLMFYSGSKDKLRYLQLKKDLSYYRLVFGQPRQQDMINKIISNSTNNENPLHITKYLINLSPIESNYANKIAVKDAQNIINNNAQINKLFSAVEECYKKHEDTLYVVANEIAYLKKLINEDVKVERKIKALSALIYLINPYDQIYDIFDECGYEDDILIIRNTYQELLKNE